MSENIFTSGAEQEEETYTFENAHALAAYERLCDDFEAGPVMLAIRSLSQKLTNPLTVADLERVRATIDPQKDKLCEKCGKATHVVSDEPPRRCPDCLASDGEADKDEAGLVGALTEARGDDGALPYYQKVLREHRRIDVAIGKANEKILALTRQLQRAEKLRDDLIEDLRAVGREAPLFGDPETVPEYDDLAYTQDRTRQMAKDMVDQYGAERFMRALRRRGIDGFERKINVVDLRRALADLKAEGESDGD